MDQTVQLAVLTSRLERLERQHRRLKTLSATSLLVIVAGLALGAGGQAGATPDMLKAKSFVVVDVMARLTIDDATGQIRAWFGLAQGTAPRVILYDADRKETWSSGR